MSVIWQKIWYDLFRHKGRTLLAVMSIAAGVFTVGGIFGMVDQMLYAMDQAHQSVAPSHINIILRTPVDQAIVDDLKGTPGVVDINPLNQVTIRYKKDPGDDWELGTLVQRDYQRQIYDKVELKGGSWPGEGALSVERLTGSYFGLEIGNKLILDVDGVEKTWQIEGLIRHPFVQPPLFGGQAHFFTDAAGLAEFGIPEGLYGQLLVQVQPYTLQKSKQVAADIRSRLGEQGYGVVVTLYQEPDRHWGRKFVEGIYIVLQVMAVVSLFLSVILVLNTLTAMITQQTDQIGVIKALGGKKLTIIALYMGEVLLLGLAALALALPLGSVFAYGMSQWFLNLFNIDYATFLIAPRAAALQVLSAVVAPMLAALWPVQHGARLTVREALATYGIGADFGPGPFDRAVDALSSLFRSSIFAVSLGNLFRRKGRLVLTLFVLVTAGVMFLVVMSLIASVKLTLDNEQARRAFDLRLGFTRLQEKETVFDLLNQATEVDQAELWLSRNAVLLRSGERLEDSAGLGAQLLGIPAGSEMYRPVLVSGRWLEAGDGRGIVLSAETAEKNGVFVGDKVVLDLGDLGESEWEVLGTYRVVYDSGFQVEPLYAPLSAVEEIMGLTNQGTQVLVRAAGLSTLEAALDLADRLETRFEDAGIKIDFYTTVVKLEERKFVDNQFNSVISVLLNLAMLTAAVGAIGLTGSLAISVVERTREIGVMRATGARTRTILGLYVMEGALQGFLSWLIAVPLAFVLAQPLARMLGQAMLELDLDYAFDWRGVLGWLVMVLIFATLASILPARAAAHISVRENLAY